MAVDDLHVDAMWALPSSLKGEPRGDNALFNSWMCEAQERVISLPYCDDVEIFEGFLVLPR